MLNAQIRGQNLGEQCTMGSEPAIEFMIYHWFGHMISPHNTQHKFYEEQPSNFKLASMCPAGSSQSIRIFMKDILYSCSAVWYGPQIESSLKMSFHPFNH